MRHHQIHYEYDDQAFPAAAYKVTGYQGVAFYVRGWETIPDEDTEWSGDERRTGQVVVTMIGDDRRIVVDHEDLAPIDRADCCSVCGQLGCAHDGLDRSDGSDQAG